jgi:HD-GYP domain-containing protein (c-di-GMP phosphodiesterase class II)
MATTRTLAPARRTDGPRKLTMALDAVSADAPHILEVVALRPSDDLDMSWLLDGETGVTRRLAAALRGVAEAHGGGSYRLDRLIGAVLAPATLAPGTVAMAVRAAIAGTSESLADCVFHGSVALPEEETGTQALALALARLQARARWSSRSTERQVRDVLLRLLATRRSGPSPRVAELALRVGRRLGLAIGDLDVVVRAAELQDLGKALIPDAILTKSGRLTPEEWEVVRRHPLVAEEILGAVPALAPVARIVRSTQEHYDGSGYPDAVHGEAIPVGARIIAVCIAYDAMTSDRPYRPALPVRAAIAEICRCAGLQFDPRVVDAFCAVVDEREDEYTLHTLGLAA